MSNPFFQFDADFDKVLEGASVAGGSFAKIDIEGAWVVKIVEASYGANQAGTGKRGFFKVEVVENLDGTEDRIGARTHLYMNEGKSNDQTIKNLAPWRQTFINLIGKEKLLTDVADFDDLIQSIISHSNKLLKRGTDILVVMKTRKQKTQDEKGRDQFYKNIYVYEAPAASIESLPEAPKPEIKGDFEPF